MKFLTERLLNEANESGLIIGKFRILTNAHAALIQHAINKFGFASIVMVTGKATLFSKQIRKLMLDAFLNQRFKGKVEVQEHHNADLVAIKAMCKFTPVALFCGSDRVFGYKKMVQNYSLGIEVIETKRGDEDISASKVIANIHDEAYFKANTPKEIWPYYEEIKQFYMINEDEEVEDEISDLEFGEGDYDFEDFEDCNDKNCENCNEEDSVIATDAMINGISASDVLAPGAENVPDGSTSATAPVTVDPGVSLGTATGDIAQVEDRIYSKYLTKRIKPKNVVITNDDIYEGEIQEPEHREQIQDYIPNIDVDSEEKSPAEKASKKAFSFVSRLQNSEEPSASAPVVKQDI